MLRAGQDGFVLKHERNREQQFKPLIQGGQQKLAGSTSVTPQGRNHHVSVEHGRSRHVSMILHAISLNQAILDSRYCALTGASTEPHNPLRLKRAVLLLAMTDLPSWGRADQPNLAISWNYKREHSACGC